MPIEPNRLWALGSIQRQRRRSFSVLCFSCPARLRRRQKGGSQGRPIKPATAKTVAAKPAKAAAKPKKSAATTKPKKTAAAAAGTKRKAPEKKVVAKPKKSPAAKAKAKPKTVKSPASKKARKVAA